MFVFILRLFGGYCRFEADTPNPVRLFNRLHQNGVYFWNPKVDQTRISFCCMKKHGGTVDSVFSDLGFTADTVRGHGLPFLLSSVKLRVIAGVILAAMILLPVISSFFVAEITVTGNRSIDESNILSLLASQGVSPYAYIPNIDVKQVRQSLLLGQPKLAWAAVNIEGNTVEVIVHEKSGDDYVLPDDPCNIVASCDAILYQLDVLSGKQVVFGKTAVHKGQLLVSGFLETEAGKLSYHHAQARALAEVTLTKSYTVDFTAPDYKMLDKTETRRSIWMFGREIKLYRAANLPKRPYAKKAEKNALSLFGIKLPLAFGRIEYTLYEETPSTLTKTDGVEILKRCFREYELYELEGDIILEKSFSTIEQDGKLTMTGVYRVQTDIAKEVKIGIAGEEP